MNGALEYWSDHQDLEVLCTVTEACCTPAGRDPHGEVKSWFLRVFGTLIPVVLMERFRRVQREVELGKLGMDPL